jgi:hypothetical protein
MSPDGTTFPAADKTGGSPGVIETTARTKKQTRKPDVAVPGKPR